MIVIALVFTLVLGLHEWIQTLATRANLGTMWGNQSNDTQSLLQQKVYHRIVVAATYRTNGFFGQFKCCGYINSTTPLYVQDSICSSDIMAASMDGCVTAFSSYAEQWLNYIFTAAFGIVGMDFVLLLCASMLIKYRKEQLRYRLIDQKWGTANI
jgi:hypothetical protein